MKKLVMPALNLLLIAFLAAACNSNAKPAANSQPVDSAAHKTAVVKGKSCCTGKTPPRFGIASLQQKNKLADSIAAK